MHTQASVYVFIQYVNKSINEICLLYKAIVTLHKNLNHLSNVDSFYCLYDLYGYFLVTLTFTGGTETSPVSLKNIVVYQRLTEV